MVYKRTEEANHRDTGTFYTPTIWVQEAHQMISDKFGKNWKEEYTVWDCAAGQANLTRDYNFKELYLSTLEQKDINTINSNKYKNTIAFKYDFVNEVGINNVPDSLKKVLNSSKKVLFFINPPYVVSRFLGNNKKKLTNSAIRLEMNRHKLGFASRQLYAQFLYKILLLKEKYNNIDICIFAPPLYLTGQSFKNFRKTFYSNFEFIDGFLFQASNFKGLSPLWGISFILWKNKKNIKEIPVYEQVNFGQDIEEQEEEYKECTHPEYIQWNNDCIIYSLFNNSSQQSSLRNIDYKNKKWDIVNNFFFMSNKEMHNLAIKCNYKDMIKDCKKFDKDRYVYNILKTTNLSDDAQYILKLAKKLVRKSVKDREGFDKKYHLNCWDSGWAQLKPLYKVKYKEEYAEFVKAYKKFEDRMRDGVYKFGFLK